MAAHELYLLHLGQMGARDDAGQTHWGQVPGYLIRTAGGRTVLVDTGNPAALIGKETADPWWPLLNDTRPEDDVVSRLAELGIAPGDVDLLVSTHFDFDHCGRHDAFAAVGTESIVQQSQLAAARDNPRFDHALWDLPGIRYTAVDGDVELEPGLQLLLTPGHVPGHQSVFVETADGPVLLAIDAISHAAHLEMAELPPQYPDPVTAMRSRDRLRDLAAETGAIILFGHDGEQWETLSKSPLPFRRP
jgi:N-acyl homoserine lactone hydrolase